LIRINDFRRASAKISRFSRLGFGTERSIMARDVTGGDTWYVAFRQPSEVPGVYVRNSVTFRTETDAKKFAGERLAEGCDVTAGTINPHRPKRTIGLSQISAWLETRE
jgi:hypothetical protein